MSSIQASTFDVDFIERTENIINYCCSQKDFSNDFTLLINCLLGLLILPKEYYEKKNLFNSYNFNIKTNKLSQEIIDIFSNDKAPEHIQDIISSPKKCIIYNKKGEEKDNMKCSFITILRHLRNAVSHCNITPVKSNDKDEWEGIILRDIDYDSDKMTMEIYLTENEIKYLVNFIIDQYKQARKYKKHEGYYGY